MTHHPQTPPPPPSRPPTQRNGCLTALMILAGSVLLLPGICALMIAGLDSSVLTDATTVVVGLIFLAISACGIGLIYLALRPAR
jgi:hypothetical protein